ncbi:MAG TPA: multicopper oxidase domain-containing protein [Candidatus Thermoplasmatota archaeon]|nr:multicopper oxidase domain-containing protein [Candidatus Thermoplasmatota archaeon]
MDRRKFVKGAAITGAAAAAAFGAAKVAAKGPAAPRVLDHEHGHPVGLSVPRQTADGLDPGVFLEAFDYGTLDDGSPAPRISPRPLVRNYLIVASPTEIEVARGVRYPAWAFNGGVPGPTLRATEGDTVRVRFLNGDLAHPHTLHFHGIHSSAMDGVDAQVEPGGEFVYEFPAEPFGCHLYHCHTMPLTKHIAKGLYGAYIVDPAPPLAREPAREMVMVMNSFDVDFDGGNEFYTVNGIANYYLDHPIKIAKDELVRVYLVNLTEFDPVNSLHTHANFFKWWRTGTQLGPPYEITDTVMLCQGERGILEFRYKYPGKYLFHAHQSEFAELGWSGFFEVS